MTALSITSLVVAMVVPGAMVFIGVVTRWCRRWSSRVEMLAVRLFVSVLVVSSNGLSFQCYYVIGQSWRMWGPRLSPQRQGIKPTIQPFWRWSLIGQCVFSPDEHGHCLFRDQYVCLLGSHVGIGLRRNREPEGELRLLISQQQVATWNNLEPVPGCLEGLNRTERWLAAMAIAPCIPFVYTQK